MTLIRLREVFHLGSKPKTMYAKEKIYIGIQKFFLLSFKP